MTKRLKFKDGETHRRVMQSVATRAQEEIRRLRPESRIATVTSIDPVNHVCRVQYINDDEDFPVRMGASRPQFIGQNVRIGRNQRGQRWIEDIIGEARFWFPGDFKYTGRTQTDHQSLAPEWYLCDGSPFDPSVDPALFAAIGYRYGTDVATSFPMLPDGGNRFLRGNAAQTGAGSDTHTHTFSDGGHTHGSGTLYAAFNFNASVLRSRLAGNGGFSNSNQDKAVSGAITTATSATADSTATGGSTSSAVASGTTGSASNVPAYTGANLYIHR